MEQCCQRNVSGSRHLSHSKSSPRRRGTRHLRPPTRSRLQTGLEIQPSRHKAQLKNQSDTLFGYFRPHIARRSRACPLGLRIFTTAMHQNPARCRPVNPHPRACLAIQAGASTQDCIAASHEPRRRQPQPAYAPRQARAPAIKTGSPRNSMQRLRRTHKYKLASQLSCRKLSTPSAT